jgi:hypothetical protein
MLFQSIRLLRRQYNKLRKAANNSSRESISVFFNILCHVAIHKTLNNNHWYLVTILAGHLELAGHLDLAGFYFSKCPAKFVTGPHIHLVTEKAQV